MKYEEPIMEIIDIDREALTTGLSTEGESSSSDGAAGKDTSGEF